MSDEKQSYDYELQLEHLKRIANLIAEFVNDKDRQYGSSWRKRGGAGAFMVIARKWDRIEQACERSNAQYDLFECFAEDIRNESIHDDVTDLIGYLLVLLEYMVDTNDIKICGQTFDDFVPEVRTR